MMHIKQCLDYKKIPYMKFKRENKDYSPHYVSGQDLSGVLAAGALFQLSELGKADDLDCRPLNVTFIYRSPTDQEKLVFVAADDIAPTSVDHNSDPEQQTPPLGGAHSS